MSALLPALFVGGTVTAVVLWADAAARRAWARDMHRRMED